VPLEGLFLWRTNIRITWFSSFLRGSFTVRKGGAVTGPVTDAAWLLPLGSAWVWARSRGRCGVGGPGPFGLVGKCGEGACDGGVDGGLLGGVVAP